MKLKKEHGKLVIKGLGIVLTQNSTEEEVARALKHAPHIAQFLDGATSKAATKTKD